MEVSPKTFREVEFREKMRGYHPEDVDQFLEQMAVGVADLQERLRQAVERAQRAEVAAAESGTSDEALRRTLVLAQRTADMAVQEAREEAGRIVAAAEARAKSIVGEAEERARRMHNEALADVHAELAKLEAVRAQSQQEVDILTRWAEEHRTHLATTLSDALAMLERGGLLAPAPTSTPIDVPAPPRSLAPAPSGERATAERPPLGGEPADATRAMALDPPRRSSAEPAPADPAPADAAYPPAPPAPGPSDPTEVVAAQPAGRGTDYSFEDDDDDPAMTGFFADADPGEDRRFGARLRRRR
jgi:cell division initiation protein